jgi:hypothetical protein
MKMKHVLLLVTGLYALCSIAIASPFVTSDPTTQKVTHCGILLDSGAKVDVPVTTTNATSAVCKYDISLVTVGPHTIKATFVNIDPIWGRSESVTSAPLDFVRPDNAITNPPTNLGIVK